VLISTIDLLALTFGLDDPMPEGIGRTRQIVGVVGSVIAALTTLPIGVARAFILDILAKWLNFPIYWYMPGYNDTLTMLYIFICDLSICCLYFVIFLALYRIWRHCLKKSG